MKGQVEWPSEKEKLHQLHESAQKIIMAYISKTSIAKGKRFPKLRT